MTKKSFIHFRASNYEYAMIKAMAGLEQRNLSEMLRELVREGYSNRNINSIGIRKYQKEELGIIEKEVAMN